jgi:SAM-dependent MidA family methyltransferase
MPDETPLTPILREEIRAAGGKITFARFMELCLYHPQHGYYNTERIKLGRRGDFYTSAHAGPVFARLLASYFKMLWQELGKPERFDLAELGPGDGSFAAELLPWIAKRFPDFSSNLHYTLIEQSSVLRARLREKLAAFGGTVSYQIAGVPPRFDGCIFANEFLDALPIHILVWRGSGWLERYVSLAGGNLGWTESNPSPRTIGFVRMGTALVEEPYVLQEGFIAEICPDAVERIQTLCKLLSRGELLIVDYGYTLDEWKAGRFPQGSGLGYHRHQVNYDLLANPGEQDLTAHVNFTQLKMASQASGLEPVLQMSQAKFLMELGEPDQFRDVFMDCATDRERQHRALQLKTLIVPQGMGTTFQVLRCRKGMGPKG